MRDRLLLSIGVGLLLSALITALPVVPHGRTASTSTASAAEVEVSADISLPVGALGGVGMSVALMGGLLFKLRGAQGPGARRRTQPDS